ncbi:hypothetical protein HYH02_004402 [Chlamydomonas schloesseri]|uniref:Uncharacterized protein n=1 Tax=Chlamydomonas schloesseri TaxID=2026947 RepID=A0A835WP89_9CHLO|nr:hypothetical protein HYH02_004402 [Chlamydomonas schloesseri]|eukprot:KAG2451135.1 hypothetical protein HYH02_004402 [Chlamydomonas schloesseri]
MNGVGTIWSPAASFRNSSSNFTGAAAVVAVVAVVVVVVVVAVVVVVVVVVVAAPPLLDPAAAGGTWPSQQQQQQQQQRRRQGLAAASVTSAADALPAAPVPAPALASAAWLQRLAEAEIYLARFWQTLVAAVATMAALPRDVAQEGARDRAAAPDGGGGGGGGGKELSWAWARASELMRLGAPALPPVSDVLVTLAASTPDVAAAAAHGYVRTMERMVRRAARASTDLALRRSPSSSAAGPPMMLPPKALLEAAAAAAAAAAPVPAVPGGGEASSESSAEWSLAVVCGQALGLLGVVRRMLGPEQDGFMGTARLAAQYDMASCTAPAALGGSSSASSSTSSSSASSASSPRFTSTTSSSHAEGEAEAEAETEAA